MEEVLTEGGCLGKAPEATGENEAEGTELENARLDVNDTGGLESRELRMDKKRFFFDVGCNPRGTFLRISEVANGTRTRVNVPLSGWKEFRDVLTSYIDNAEKSSVSK